MPPACACCTRLAGSQRSGARRARRGLRDWGPHRGVAQTQLRSMLPCSVLRPSGGRGPMMRPAQNQGGVSGPHPTVRGAGRACSEQPDAGPCVRGPVSAAVRGLRGLLFPPLGTAAQAPHAGQTLTDPHPALASGVPARCRPEEPAAGGGEPWALDSVSRPRPPPPGPGCPSLSQGPSGARAPATQPCRTSDSLPGPLLGATALRPVLSPGAPVGGGGRQRAWPWA